MIGRPIIYYISLIIFQDADVFWPTDTDSPMIVGQLSVKLLKEENLDEGIIKMMEFEIAINMKVPRRCFTKDFSSPNQNLLMLSFEYYLSDHHEILHMLRQQCCRCMCKMLWCSDSYN